MNYPASARAETRNAPKIAPVAPCGVTWWPSLANPRGRFEELPTWSALFDALVPSGPHLGDEHPGWSAARFEGDRRALANVREVFALTFDYDDGSPIAEALERWQGALGYLHTTRSHTAERPRYRLILPVARAVSADEYRRLWLALRARAGSVDAATKDPSRLWFLPSEAPGGFERHVLRGHPLDPDALLAEAPRPAPPVRVAPLSSDVERRAVAYLATMPPAIAGQRGHDATWRAAIALARGFALDEHTTLRLLLSEYNPRCEPPWSERELRHKAKQATNASATLGYLLEGDRDREREALRAQWARDEPPPFDGAPWPDPLPIGRDATPPPFPVEVLPKWIGDFVRRTAASVQVPEDMPAMFALGAVAAVTGGRLRVQAWPGFEDACNVYLATALPPGSVKSPVQRSVTAPIERLEDALREQARPTIAKAEQRRTVAEKRLKRAEDAAAKAEGRDAEKAMLDVEAARDALDRETVPPLPRLIVDDTTPEQLKTLLALHGGRLAMLSAESSLFGNFASQRYSSNPNIEAILAAHPGDTLRVDRRGREEKIRDPRLTICIAVQPAVLREAYKNRIARDRGLFARFLYALPPSNVGRRDFAAVPPPVPAHVQAAWEERLFEVAAGMQQLEEPLVLHLAPAAVEMFRAWRADVEPRRDTTGDLASLADWAAKLDGHLLRLAGLLHVTHNPQGTQIGADTLARAILLTDYFTAHAMVAFDAMGEDDLATNARKVIDWARRRGEPRFMKQEVTTGFKGRLTASELEPVLAHLVKLGRLRRAQVERQERGPKPEVYELHPTDAGKCLGNFPENPVRNFSSTPLATSLAHSLESDPSSPSISDEADPPHWPADHDAGDWQDFVDE